MEQTLPTSDWYAIPPLLDSINDSANTIPQAFDAVSRAHGHRTALAGRE